MKTEERIWPPSSNLLYHAVPPKIVDDQTSSDLVVKENSVVNLTCQAEGWPKPELRWRRADGEMIKYQGGTGKCECEIVRWFPDSDQLGKYSNAHELFSTVTTVDGNSLLIPSATRVHIGRYYCIASNGIPPTVSKIISLKVQCKYKLSIIQCG